MCVGGGIPGSPAPLRDIEWDRRVGWNLEGGVYGSTCTGASPGKRGVGAVSPGPDPGMFSS